MKRISFSFIVLLCVSLFALEARVWARDKWISVRSEHFKLVGNASESEIREAAMKLEQYHTLLARLFAENGISLTVETNVIVFKNEDSFKPFRPLYQGKPTKVAGYFQPGTDINYIAIKAERRGENPYRTVFHELVHLFLDNRLRGMPLCLNEGLAEYYSTFKISDGGKKLTLGQENAQHVRLLAGKELLPLETLLKVDYNSPQYNEDGQRALFYAQSWALAHYLLHRDGAGGLEKFTRLLDLLAEGKTVEDGLHQAFQADVAEIEKGLKMYVRQLPFPTRVTEFDGQLAVDLKLQTAQITEAEAQAYLGDLLLHLNHLDEAEIYFQQALAQNPLLVMAQASLGMLRLKQLRAAEAIELLRRAAARDSGNYLTQYYYAYALSREEMGEEGSVSGYGTQAALAMRAALARTRELSPRFIEAYRLQAFINLALNEQLDEAVRLLKRALELAPGRQDILLVLAQVQVRQLDFTAARETLKPVLHRPAELKLRHQAQELLEDMKFAEEQARRFSHQAAALNEEQAVAQSPPTPELSQTEKAHSGNQKLAKRFKGERVRGVLKRIECLDSGVTLFVQSGDRLLRLHGEELRRVFFVAYVVGLEKTVTCGPRSPENLVVVTYRPSKTARADFDGEAIAIEFVPEDIDIEP
jgi:Putative Zn-dependent protease, contains TPR repeats